MRLARLTRRWRRPPTHESVQVGAQPELMMDAVGAAAGGPACSPGPTKTSMPTASEMTLASSPAAAGIDVVWCVVLGGGGVLGGAEAGMARALLEAGVGPRPDLQQLDRDDQRRGYRGGSDKIM
jgi:hypothetical protein